ncbi:leucyl aminopeptidase [Corynebacterium sp. 335C]
MSDVHATSALLSVLPAVGRRALLSGGDSVPEGADALVVGVLDGDDGLELIGSAALAGHDAEVLAALSAVEAKGSLESVSRVPAPEGVAAAAVVAVGLGSEDPSSDDVRRAAGAAARALSGAGVVASALGAIDAAAALEGAALGAYSYTGLKGSGEERDDASRDGSDDDVQQVTVLGVTAEEAARAQHVAEAVCIARDLVNTPSSHLYPESFADAARALGEAEGLEVEVMDDPALAEGGYGGLTAVGGGSSRGPRLVRLIHRGAGEGADASRRVGLVGKGVTFDTGGISIKPSAQMGNMISDMGGAAGVIGAVVLAARLDLPLEVIATVPMAENMPSARAYRPGDVITQYGGTTVEVQNTDAEGRLILADAIVRACEDDVSHLIDTATLTGAQLVALGGRNPGVMGTDDFRDRVAELSRSVGEGGWSMPMPEQLADGLKSPIADLQNIGAGREGGMSVAASFLEHFVADGVEWAHIDVAGPAYNTHSAWGYTPVRGTGVPVRTILAALEDIAAGGAAGEAAAAEAAEAAEADADSE